MQISVKSILTVSSNFVNIREIYLRNYLGVLPKTCELNIILGYDVACRSCVKSISHSIGQNVLYRSNL